MKREKVLTDLSQETLAVIHYTLAAPAIKRLLSIHDILQLNLQIQREFSDFDGIPWDKCSLKDLDTTRRELVTYHWVDFNPYLKFNLYNAHLSVMLEKAWEELNNAA